MPIRVTGPLPFFLPYSIGDIQVMAVDTISVGLSESEILTILGSIIDIIHGKGYRITTADRTIGGPTAAPDGFLVLNQTNNKCFKAQGGVWVDGGIFPPQYLAQWYLS